MNKLGRTLTMAVAAVGLAGSAAAGASGPRDIANAGEPAGVAAHQDNIGWLDQTDVTKGVTYQASTFPVRITFRPPDALWGAVQARGGSYRFVQLYHRFAHDANGKVTNWGRGLITFEAGTGKTRSVAAVAKTLHATALMTPGKITTTRLAGFRGETFDTTIVGTRPGDAGGIALIPFSGDPRPGGDHLWVTRGQLLRIIVLDVHGTTVVVYIESNDNAGNNTIAAAQNEHSFPVFLGFVRQMLATVTFPA